MADGADLPRTHGDARKLAPRSTPKRRAGSKLRAVSVPPIRPRVSVVALACGLACGPRGTTAEPSPGRLATPIRGFEFPSLEVEWTPPMLAAGDVAGLAAAVARHPQVSLVLGPRLAGAGWIARGDALLRTLSPTTRVTQHAQASLLEVVADPDELQALRRGSPGADGRPRYAAGMLLRARAAGPVVAIDDVMVDLPRWQALPSSSVGSCEPAMRALADGQEAGLARLAPFLDLADAQMGRLYRAKVAESVVGLAGECAGLLQGFVACAGDAGAACPGAPRIVLVGGARIVATDVTVPESCGGARIRGLAEAAAEEASAGFDAGWTLLADRLGTLTEVHAALEDVCVPRRRRFTDYDVKEARARLGRIGAALASDEVTTRGRWRRSETTLAVPGLGVTRELARFDAGEGSVNAEIVAEAQALREFVLSRGLCKAGHSPTPMAAVVGVPGQAAEFLGYFYEEELACGELPPLRE